MRVVGGVIGLMVLGLVAWFVLQNSAKQATHTHSYEWSRPIEFAPAVASSRARTALAELGYRVTAYTSVKDGAFVSQSADSGLDLPEDFVYSHVAADRRDGTRLEFRLNGRQLTINVTVSSTGREDAADAAEPRLRAFLAKLGVP